MYHHTEVIWGRSIVSITGPFFCKVCKFFGALMVNSIADGTGIALMRLFYTKYPGIIRIFGEKLIAWSIIFVEVVIHIISSFLVFLPKVRMQTVESICLGKSAFMESVLFDITPRTRYDTLPYIMLSSTVILTCVQFIIYVTICVHCYFHDRGMRLLIRPNVIRARHRTNVIDLTGHFLHFIFDLIIPIVSITGIALLSTSTRLFFNLLMLSSYGLFGFLQIIIAVQLRRELMLLLESVFFVPKIMQVLRFLNFLGILNSIHTKVVSVRTRYYM